MFSLEYGLQSPNESDFQNYLNKIIFLNQEFLKKYVLILEDKLSQTITQRDSKDSDLIQMKSQIEKLEKVYFLFISYNNQNFFLNKEINQFQRKFETISNNRQS